MLVGMVVGACGADPRLEALVAEGLSDLQVPGTEQTFRSEQSTHEALGKTQYAEVSQRLAIADPASADEVLADAVALAESDGWIVDESFPGPAIVAHKDLSVGRGRVSLAVTTIDNLPSLVVVLGFDPPEE